MNHLPRLRCGLSVFVLAQGCRHAARTTTCSASYAPLRSFRTSCPARAAPAPEIHMESYPAHRIRNFAIIAHIDHGKSTLSDRLLELTNTIQRHKPGDNNQVLDKLKVERERGITVKAQTVSMFYKHDGEEYLLNLIDTPGHVDFSWEVARSLGACEGALLLVDASQGVQAQSISVFHAAKDKKLKIIPVLNKIDLPAAEPERIATQIQAMFDLDPNDILNVSAKTGLGVRDVLHAIIDRVPPPNAGTNHDAPLKMLLFDSLYDRYRGVISLVSIKDGELRKGDKIASCHSRKKYEVMDLGIMHPEEVPTACLRPGQVGWIGACAATKKSGKETLIGDTFHRVGQPVEPLPGFQLAKPMVYAGVYPVDSNDFPKLEESIKRLTLTDRSVSVQRESSTALGQGCRLGFLGTLHMDVFRQRLEDEYDASVIITAPTVPYKLVYHDRTEFVSNPTDFPDINDPRVRLNEVQEPMVTASIIVPSDYLGEMMELCTSHRAQDIDYRYLDSEYQSSRIMLTCRLPLGEIMTDFFDKLKSRSSGFASFDYEDAGYQKSDLVKMTFLLNGRQVDALAFIVHRSAAENIGREWALKLRKVIPRQQFEVPIQAVVGKKVIARETISAVRKDVTAGMYGGHHERKMKKLAEQKEGKKRLKRIGSVDVPQEAFFEILSSNNKSR
ncbi:translation factor GUF1, mitochondrial [Exidia glandulosa HHB12029]|uniref:Translation factor GUF1, mitochondrial n=1 Tax=Exidia glandulosa HHB12029 TaxID=1314781 RepID=A0A165HM95_EXIGL|nr:translation factor GUF1, mitochondrial [Exidia glandulosa HHB12029]